MDIVSLKDAISSIDTDEGRKRFKEYLDNTPFPHFEQHPTNKKLLIRIDKDGKRTLGHFVNRVFVEVKLEEE